MKQTTRKLTHSAIMIALALVLSMIKPVHMPYGGSITLVSMAPIILLSIKYDTKWSVFTAFVYALLQMVEGFYPPPVQNISAYIAVILLDYLLAFSVLGFAGTIARRFAELKIGAVVGSVAVIMARFTCSFLSGIIIWREYAPEGMPVWQYSLGYNGFIGLGEAIITAFVVAIAIKYLPLKKL